MASFVRDDPYSAWCSDKPTELNNSPAKPAVARGLRLRVQTVATSVVMPSDP